MSEIAEGWYDDPRDPTQYRFWASGAWTDHVVAKAPSSPPAEPPPPAPSVVQPPAPKVPAVQGLSGAAQGSSSVSDAAGNLASVDACAQVDEDSSQALGPSPVSDVSRRQPTSAGRVVEWSLAGEWCRACGVGTDSSVSPCPECAWGTEQVVLGHTRVGLVYEIGKLRRRLGVCVGDTGSSIEIHLDDKPDRLLANADVPEATPHVSPSLSPAARVHAFEQLRMTGAIKTSTNPDRLLKMASELGAKSVGAMRELFDSALERGWTHLIKASDLTSSERAWRSAHHAASKSDVPQMLKQIAHLPDGGYAARLPLLAMHLEVAIGIDSDAIGNEIGRIAPTVVGQPALALLTSRPEPAFTETLTAAISLSEILPLSRRTQWREALEGLASGTAPPPVNDECPTWLAYQSFQGLAPGEQIDSIHLRHLPPPYIEQAIASRTLDAAQAEDGLDGQQRSYALARLAPWKLSDDELSAIGHFSELARRAFVDRNETSLIALRDRESTVEHFLALHNFRDGREYVEEHLDRDVRQFLEEFDSARKLVKAEGVAPFPSSLLADPTLWPALGALVLDGRIEVTAEQRMAIPGWSEWVDLHKLISLLWNGDFAEAEQLGAQLAAAISIEEIRDEALNLRAFALAQIGRPTEALSSLEDAMEGLYTEALLVNTCLVAGLVEASVGARYLARLVDEAPTDELRISALRHAIEIWTGDTELPSETAASLRRVLELPALTDDDYIGFARLSSNIDAVSFAASPPNRPSTLTKAVAYDVFRSRARSNAGEGQQRDHSDILIASEPHLPDAAWLKAEINSWIDLHFGLMTRLDFGEAMGSAPAFDSFLEKRSDLLELNVYLVGATMAGAHFAAFFNEKDGNTINDNAANKFFYVPIERLRRERHLIEEGPRTSIEAMMYHATAAYSTTLYRSVFSSIQETDAVYNQLNQRRSWDHQNSSELRRQMRNILDGQSAEFERLERAFYYLDQLTPGIDRSPDSLELVVSMRRDADAAAGEIARIRRTL